MKLQYLSLGGKLLAGMTFPPSLIDLIDKIGIAQYCGDDSARRRQGAHHCAAGRNIPKFGSLVLFCAAAQLLVIAEACGLQRSADTSDTHQHPQTSALPANEFSSENISRQPSRGDTSDTASKSGARNAALEYDLERPDIRLSLPIALKEISDVAVLSQTEVACVQDERGIVYVYDIKSKRITDEVRFAPKGDYEGLAIVGSKFYVLRSDGLLYELSSLKQHPAVQTHELHLPFNESEGLCSDARHDRLLIAPKSYERTGEGKDTRPIYAFDLRKNSPAAEPAFELSVREIRHFAKHHDMPVPRRIKRDGESMHTVLRFMPSAIAVHPVTGDVFILSSVDHVLVSCTQNGGITGYALLDASLFRQPEGIAFFPNGDMLIANEAAGKEPTLMLFRWKARSG
jgi:hypothetical protein